MAYSMMSNDSEYLSVADFYAGKSVFITGGTGFLGKVLIEKLLYNCAEINKIYVLVRDKKGVSAVQRTEEIFEDSLFAILKQERPHDFKKLIPIAGNLAIPNLGLKPDDLEILIDNVSLVFHSAATTKFNMPLKEALKVNVEGTRHVLDLCKRMKNIKVFVHISTAYSNTDKMVVDELVYPPPVELDDVYQLVEENDGVIADSKILNGRPNTYTFSKALAETLVERDHGNIRTIIIRPSCVTAITDKPVKGWINNWYGATGLLTYSAKGLNRYIFGSGDIIVDLIPADYVANLTVVAGAKSDRTKNLSVYNSCSSSCNPITFGEVLKIFTEEAIKHNNYVAPLPELCIVTKSKWLMFPITLLLQTIPAFVADLSLWLRGKRPRYVKLQSIIILTRDLLEFFTSHSWVIKCAGARRLYASLSEIDRNLFPCDPVNIDWKKYIPSYCEGIRRYLEQKSEKN